MPLISLSFLDVYGYSYSTHFKTGPVHVRDIGYLLLITNLTSLRGQASWTKQASNTGLPPDQRVRKLSNLPISLYKRWFCAYYVFLPKI